MSKLYMLLFMCLISTSHIAFALDKTEQKIVAQIDSQIDAATKLLEETVNINSGTLNLPGVKQVGMIMQQQFDELGMKTEWLDGKGFNRAGHLLVSHGNKGPRILMIGHLDTVFAEDDSFQSYKQIDERYVAGPGITDMKGGNIIILEILRALKSLDLLNDLQLRIILTGDEERSGEPLSLSKEALIEAGKWADYALGFEDGDSNIETAVVARRGSIDWQLDVTGNPAHSSQIFSKEVGYGAIFETARILDQFRKRVGNIGDLTFNPGLIAGGTRISDDESTASAVVFGKTNVVAQTTLVKGGIRALTPQELQTAKKTMQQIVTENLAGTSAKLTFGEGYPPMAPTEGNYALLATYSQVSQDLGYGPVKAVNPRNAGAADISFVAQHVDMALDGLGLMGAGGHTREEVADMTSFAKNMHKGALLLYRLAKKQHAKPH